MSQEKYGLNDEQWLAVTSKSPTIVNASAGSGKTRALIAKIRYLLDSSVLPRNILAITFTNRAANEMKERLKKHYSNLSGMQVSTIHSMCVGIIKKFIQHTPLKQPFSIYDDGDQMSVIKTVIKSRNLSLDPYETLSAISRGKAEETMNSFEKDLAIAFTAYQQILLKNNACDFDDLLIYAYQCLQHEDCQRYYSELWQHILVDEFQDTNTIQYKIILSMYDVTLTKTMLCVGDFNQSIYGFRGARPDNMKDFIKKYNPTICDLKYNYRSCSEIITHANRFLQYGKPMIPKTATQGMVSFTQFQSQEDEAEKIALVLQKWQDYENCAILFRVNARTIQFERVFTQKRIPYKIVGALPFYKRRIAKDLLSYCKASVNKSDLESLIRIVNVPKRGFGETRQEKLLLEGWPYLIKSAEEIPRVRGFIDLLDRIKKQSPLDAVNEILHHTDYRSTLKTDSDRIMLDSFLNVISGFDSIDDLILASNFIEQDTGHGVKLMSAHASKGLEFDRVFVVGVEEELWPHKLSENIAEEERLFYVSSTRAKTWINFSYAKSRLYRGTKLDVLPSYLFTNSYQAWKNDSDMK
jgi:DNA helicase-2/ATP-dependent DNA helicase PcrA